MLINDTMRCINLALESYSIVLCLILASYQLFHLDTYRKQKYWFCGLLLSNVVMMLGDMTDWLFNGVDTPLARFFAPHGMAVFYGSSAVVILSLTGYLIEFMELRTRAAAWIWRAAAVLTGVQAALSLASCRFGLYFYYTEENIYTRGPLYLLSQFIPLAIFLMDVALIVMGRRRLRASTLMFFSSFVLLPLIGQVLQMFFYGLAFINVSATLAMFLFNINVQNEQENRLKQQEKELAEARIDIMLSQIQPHFLYNALTTIRQLCDRDTEQAKQSILDFSRFLRANMNSLTAREPIPFAREVEHTQNYINLEQQRFGKRLRVVWDIRSQDFKVPTLTLQPLVENAVRHGILRRAEGGTVTICTEGRQDGSLITISDDGVGVEAAERFSKDSSHVGLSNVRRRLWTQCRGKIMVKSSGEGTTVTVWIPRDGKE